MYFHHAFLLNIHPFSGYICEEHNNPADFFMDVIFESEAAQRHGLGDSSGKALSPCYTVLSCAKP